MASWCSGWKTDTDQDLEDQTHKLNLARLLLFNTFEFFKIVKYHFIFWNFVKVRKESSKKILAKYQSLLTSCAHQDDILKSLNALCLGDPVCFAGVLCLPETGRYFPYQSFRLITCYFIDQGIIPCFYS